MVKNFKVAKSAKLRGTLYDDILDAIKVQKKKGSSYSVYYRYKREWCLLNRFSASNYKRKTYDK